MLQTIAPGIWHLTRHFVMSGIPLTSRMTVVRLDDGKLWLHSPVALTDADCAALAGLGTVAYIVAPNKFHHLFAKKAHAAFPGATLFGAPGLAAKRPDLVGMQEIPAAPPWQAELPQLLFAGFPLANETVWFHKATGTLIVTDICQWWQGELPWAARAYGRLTGVRDRLAVPRTVRLMIRDRAAARASAKQILEWPIERVVTAHNAIVEERAHAALTAAFAVL